MARHRTKRRSMLPAWLIVVLLVSSGAGATVGLTLSSRIEGVVPVTVTQALRVGTPVAVTSSPFVRFFGGASDDATRFSAAVEMPQNSVMQFRVPLVNHSGRDLVAELVLGSTEMAPPSPDPEGVYDPNVWIMTDSAVQIVSDLRRQFEGLSRVAFDPNALARLQTAGVTATRLQDSLNQLKARGRSKKRTPLLNDVLAVLELLTGLNKELSLAGTIEPSPDGRQHIVSLVATSGLLKQASEQIAAILVQPQTPPPAPVLMPSLAFDLEGYGAINDVAQSGPATWKFTVRGSATAFSDGVVVTVTSPAGGATGYFQFAGELRTVEF